MGAFFLVKKENNESLIELKKRISESLAIFEEMELSLNQVFENDSYCCFLYNKYFFNVKSIYYEDKDNFIFNTGTLFYKSQIELDALKLLFYDIKDSLSPIEILENCKGNYALVYCLNGKLYITNDKTGIYHTFCDTSLSYFSNSFLAVSKAVKNKTLQSQELYEYVLMGTIYGFKTVFKEINLIDSKKILCISDKSSIDKKTITIPSIQNKNLNYFIDKFEEILSNIFSDVKSNFLPKTVFTGLTAGFDTRLMLASMRRIGFTPYCYVYDNMPLDIKIASLISKGEGLELAVNKYIHYPSVEDKDYCNVIKKSFFMNDGKNDSGIFYQGFDWLVRKNVFSKAVLHLNGFGGELLRNSYGLAYKSLSFKRYFKIRYDRFKYSDLMCNFDRRKYFYKLTKKFKYILNTENDILSLEQILMLLPYNHYQFWAGINQSLKCRFTHSFTPLMDLHFIGESLTIPLKYKNYGLFNAELIKHMDQRIANYPSQYGFNFFYGPNFTMKLREMLRCNLPTSIRPLIRKYLLSKKSNDIYKYFQKACLEQLFDDQNFYLSNYFRIDRIQNPNIFSRLMTMEILLRNIF